MVSRSIVPGSGVALRWLLKEQGHNYPMDKMPAIGAIPSGGVTLVRTDAGSPIEKLVGRDKPLRGGQNAPGALGPVADALITRMLGIPVEEIYGFEGYGEVAIAVERGEIEETTPGMPGLPSDIYANGRKQAHLPAVPDGTVGRERPGGSQSVGAESPTGVEEYKRLKGKDPVGEDWEAYKVLIGMSALNGVALTHPDIPADRLSALRESFMNMITDPSWDRRRPECLVHLPQRSVETYPRHPCRS